MSRFCVLSLEEVSSRPPLPKADPKITYGESLKRGYMAVNTRRNVSGATLPAVGVSTQKKDFLQLIIFKSFIQLAFKKCGDP